MTHGHRSADETSCGHFSVCCVVTSNCWGWFECRFHISMKGNFTSDFPFTLLLSTSVATRLLHLHQPHLPTTPTPPVHRYMLDELQFRKPNDDGVTLPRTIYLPELDMEVVVLPPAYAPGRELPSNAADIDSRVKFIRTSMTFGGVSFPKPYSLPKPPRYDQRLMFLRFPQLIRIILSPLRRELAKGHF